MLSAAAYQKRLAEERVTVDRAALEELLRAVEAAASAGDPEAPAVQTGTADALLRNLALLFWRKAG